MFRFLISCVFLTLPIAAAAEDLVLNDLRSRNAVQLTANELKQLMPGAKVANRRQDGSLRHWTNEADGKFVASGDAPPGKIGHHANPAGGKGSWRLGDKGTYCVAIEWPRRSENWCRYIFRLGDKYYGVGSLDDGAGIASEFEFSR